jgi:gluconokinase
MGVSGSGKSTIAAQVAGRLGYPYIDADDLHPPANVAKMRSGTPLNDEDRWPWLDSVAETLDKVASQAGGVVMACSALRRIYRDRLRKGTDRAFRFIFLDASFDVIKDRLARRLHHFMPESLLISQFETLERPGPDETDVLTISADQPPDVIVAQILAMLAANSRRSET